MSRLKGHNGAAVAVLEREENTAFALTRVHQDLRLIELRIQQALRRGGPRELLEPALTLIDESKARIERVRQA
jgi:hypothetical protein